MALFVEEGKKDGQREEVVEGMDVNRSMQEDVDVNRSMQGVLAVGDKKDGKDGKKKSGTFKRVSRAGVKCDEGEKEKKDESLLLKRRGGVADMDIDGLSGGRRPRRMVWRE